MRTEQLGIAILRVVVGILFLAHGAQKLFVLGFGNVSHMFASLGIPQPYLAAIVVTLVEFVGGILLVLGLGTRWAAILLAIEMAVAIGKVHLHNGLFINKGGYEYALVMLAATLALALAGSGSPALERIGKRGR
jgi:putative oxidoreductase